MNDRDHLITRIEQLEKENQRLRGMEDSNNRHRNAFRIIAEAAVFSGSIGDMCQRVINDLVETLNFDIGSIRLLAEDGRTLNAVAVTGLSEDDIKRLIRPQDLDDLYYLAPWVARNREAFFAPDVSHHPVLKTHGERIREIGIQSLISWPILDPENQILGVLHLTARKPRRIDESDRKFFGTVAGLFGLLLKRKMTEEELRISEENYSSIFQNIQDAFFRVAVDGRLIMLNPSGVKLLGYTSADELLGLPVAETVYFYPEDRPKYLSILNQDGFLKDMDIALRRKDGSKIVVEMSAYLRRDANGSPVAMEGILRDVSQRRKLENELLKAQKLESVGLLAGGLAHDFNNILTAVLGNVSLAKSLIDPSSRAALRLERAEDACLRARDITQQLLTFSRGGEPDKKVSNVGILLAQTVGFSLRGSNIRPKITCPEDLWPAEIDPGQISQAINNLIINAVQAMPDGGTLSVSAINSTSFNRQTDQHQPELEIQIQDSGKGMDADTLSRIFDPYYTTKPTGNGLGLTTVYSIIQKHYGSVSVHSNPGEGTTFFIRIPALPNAIIDSPLATVSDLKAPGRVMMMDDDDTILEVARSLFSEMAIEFHTAKDGEEAIDKYVKGIANKTPFDVLVIDLTIPGGMGGRDTIKRLLAIDPNVCAIVSSGYSNDPIMANFKDYGFVGCLKKPYEVKELSRIVCDFLRQRSREA